MNIDSDYARSMAEQLANYDVQPTLARIQRNESNYRSQLTAVNQLDSALRTFRSATRDLNSVGGSMLVNSATLNQEGYATANVKANAQPGSYQFFVKQLASQHQLALQNLTDGDVPGSGNLKLSVGGEAFELDLAAADSDGDGSTSLAELSAAINNAADNTGVRATLVRSNGEVSLVLTSEKGGAANQISLEMAGASGAFANAIANPTQLAEARDAEVYLGGENGLLMTNSSNTFEDMIDGVSLTFNRVHVSGEAPLAVEIGQDQSATREKVDSFVSAFNALMGSFDSLTASGGESDTRGPLAGDSSIRSIESMLNRLIRDPFGGKQLAEYGIVANRDGRLTVDSSRFEAAMSADPEGLNKLFMGRDNLLDNIDKNLNQYVNVTNGVLTNRKESLNQALRRTDEQMNTAEQQFERNYARYLKQYTSMMQIMASMQQTQGMFG